MVDLLEGDALEWRQSTKQEGAWVPWLHAASISICLFLDCFQRDRRNDLFFKMLLFAVSSLASGPVS